MKKIITIFSLTLFTFTDHSSAQIQGLFLDSVYSSYKRIPNVVYGSAYNFQKNEQDTLLLDIYEPDASTDYLRPVLIYVHGGGFTDGDKGGPGNIPVFAQYFAPRGWVVASIDYRLGVEDYSTTSDNYEEGYEATQDAKASIRFFRRYAAEYCVDTSSIFIGGVSAGGALAMTCAYWDQAEANPFVDVQKLGPLDQSSGNPGYSSNVRAIINCWGGINDTSWMNNNYVPQDLFQGTADSTVPYHSGYNASHIYIYGCYDIHQAALRYGIESYLHPFWGFGHGVPTYSPQMDTVLMLTDDFLYNHLDSRLLAQESCQLTIGIPPIGSSEKATLHISPNPSDGTFEIQNSLGNEVFEGTFNLFDVTGKLISSQYLNIRPSSSADVNFTTLQPGVYYAQFKNSTQSFTDQIIIVHR